MSFDAGLATVVDLDGGGTVLLTTKAVPAAGAGQYAALGVNAADHRIIVSKAVYSTRDGYPMASGFIAVDTPGARRVEHGRFTYHHRRRPMFPFERGHDLRLSPHRRARRPAMRFAILGISHETNTFSRVPTDYAQFEASDILRGQELVDRVRRRRMYTIAGYLQAAARARLRGRAADVGADRPAGDDHQGRLRPADRRDVRDAP